jgi:SNF2 family DNA or RNA helicase
VSSDDEMDKEDGDERAEGETGEHEESDLSSAEPFEAVPDEQCLALCVSTKFVDLLHISTPRVYLPTAMAKLLKRHQKTGVRFLWTRLVKGRTGGLLLHDMGVGKTIQTIAVLVGLRAAGANPETRRVLPPHLRELRVLLLCPAPVVENWASELAKFLPLLPGQSEFDLDRSVLGKIIVTSQMRGPERKQSILSWAKGAGVLVMSQEVFRAYASSRDNTVRKALFDGATITVVDEVHKAREEGTQLRKALNMVATRSRIGLTGTPLANSVLDVYSLVD